MSGKPEGVTRSRRSRPKPRHSKPPAGPKLGRGSKLAIQGAALLLGVSLVILGFVYGPSVVPGRGPTAPAVPQRLAEPGTAAYAYKWGPWDSALSDEFVDSGAPAPAAWDSYDSEGHAGNGLRRPAQNTVEDGHLQIAGLADGTSGGMMSTAVHPAFGRWEVRMRLDKQGVGRAYHAVVALIPYGVPYDSGAGDLDFAETDAGSGEVFVFIHYPDRMQDFASVKVDLSAWHTYAIEVAPDHISWFVDGKIVMTDTNPAAVTGVRWTTNVQLDAYQPSGLAPSNLQVDYFRHFPLPEGAPPIPATAPATGSYNVDS